MANETSASEAKRANDRTDELIRAQEAKESAAIDAAKRSLVRVRAELRRTAYGTWHIEVTNEGPATARRVGLQIRGTAVGTPMIIQGPSSNAAREQINASESWYIPLTGANGGGLCPIEGTIHWQHERDGSEVTDFHIDAASDNPPFIQI